MTGLEHDVRDIGEGDIVIFTRWSDYLATRAEEEEGLCRGYLGLMLRVVGSPSVGLLKVRYRNFDSGVNADFVVDRSAVDYIGPPGCGADMRAHFIAGARIYVSDTIEHNGFNELVQRFATLDAFIKMAALTKQEVKLVDSETRFRLIMESIAADSTWDEIKALYDEADAAELAPREDLEATAAIVLHRRALKEGLNLDFALKRLQVVRDRIAAHHPHHPWRRFSLESSVVAAINTVRGVLDNA